MIAKSPKESAISNPKGSRFDISGFKMSVYILSLRKLKSFGRKSVLQKARSTLHDHEALLRMFINGIFFPLYQFFG